MKEKAKYSAWAIEKYGSVEQIDRMKRGETMGMRMCQSENCYELTHFRWPNKAGIDYCSWNCYLRH